jgi:hypothetical protein
MDVANLGYYGYSGYKLSVAILKADRSFVLLRRSSAVPCHRDLIWLLAAADE